MGIKIGLIGYGSMGKEIEKIADKNQFEICEIIDIDNPLSVSNDYKFDVAIDFSSPNAVLSNIQILSELKKSVVIGTTGWYEKLDEVKAISAANGIGLVYGTNFSLGVQLFFRLIAEATKIYSGFEGFDFLLHEIHHKRKKDSPSGTALTLGELVLKNHPGLNKIISSPLEGELPLNSLQISSLRGGEITGTHSLIIDSLAETIELTHRAKNRSGFASGALVAAKWIHGKSGTWDFSDVLNELSK